VTEACLLVRRLMTPLGQLLAVGSERGLIRLALPCYRPDDVVSNLTRKLGARALVDARAFDFLADQLDAYFSGELRAFDLALDLSLTRGFHRIVLGAMQTVVYGETITYSELAGRSGRPSAARAAGHACAINPIPIVVPCHRILRRDGTLGGYACGLHHKRFLLALESAQEK
jgi:methylated-DNA-[protein]-cysteine S-methyltransferase